jgi:hypothetical protein
MPSSKRKTLAKIQRRIRFEFTADRFGYRAGDGATGVGYARSVVYSLDHWADTVQLVFGNIETALDWAGRARILAFYPAWSTATEALGRVKVSLGLAALDVRAETKVNPSADLNIVDDKTRDALEELRQYLQMLDVWAQAFQAGIWAALVAASGATGGDHKARRLVGLKTLAAVYGFDMGDGPNDVFRRLSGLGWPPDVAPPPDLGHVLDTRSRLASSSTSHGSFLEDPSRLTEWSKALRGDLVTMMELPSIASDDKQWRMFEGAFWQQWLWPTSGSVNRQERNRDVALFDLIHAARHGGIPVVPWRGGNLSIGQWCRIIALAQLRSDAVPADAVNAAFNNLGVSELAGALLSTETSMVEILKDPIAVISPRSSQSVAWTWRPEPGVKALTLMPEEVVRADQHGAGDQSGTETKGPSSNADRDPIALLLARSAYGARSGAILHFVEIGESPQAEFAADWAVSRLSPSLAERVYFGAGANRFAFTRYLHTPSSAGALLAIAREEFGDLFLWREGQSPSLAAALRRAIWTLFRPLLRIAAAIDMRRRDLRRRMRAGNRAATAAGSLPESWRIR